MEPYLLVALVKKKMPLVTGETAYGTRLFKFLMDPNTASLESYYETEKCKNVTLEHLDTWEMELFIKMVSKISYTSSFLILSFQFIYI